MQTFAECQTRLKCETDGLVSHDALYLKVAPSLPRPCSIIFISIRMKWRRLSTSNQGILSRVALLTQ